MWYYPIVLRQFQIVLSIYKKIMQGEMGCSAIVTLITSTVLADRKRLDVGMLLLHLKPMRGF